MWSERLGPVERGFFIDPGMSDLKTKSTYTVEIRNVFYDDQISDFRGKT
jgi:hypothetical protein